jgi:hypothetical protein
MPRLRASGICVIAAVVVWVAPSVRAQRDTARVYVTVLNRDRPVTGLGAKDFTIKEDRTMKTVVSAQPATERMQVVMLTDRFGLDTSFNIFDVRAALTAFTRTLHQGSPETEIGFITFDGAAVPIVRPTTSTAALETAFRDLSPSNTSPVLLEAIFSASVALERVPTDRRIIMVLMAGYKPDMSTRRSPTVVTEMRRAGVALWTLEGRSTTQPNPQSIDREAVTDLAGKASGGLRESVGQGTALEGRAKRMAELLLAQYVVEYAAPARGAQGLEVGVSVKGAKVIAPTWPPLSGPGRLALGTGNPQSPIPPIPNSTNPQFPK